MRKIIINNRILILILIKVVSITLRRNFSL